METRWPAYFAPFTPSSTCGFLGFNKLEKVAHVGENLLTRLRDRQLTLNPEITTALLGMVDAVRQMLKEIESNGQDGDADYQELRETLTRLLTSAAGSVGLVQPSSPAPVDTKTGTAPEPPSSTSVLEETLPVAAGMAQPKPVEPPAGPRKKRAGSQPKPSREAISGASAEHGLAQAKGITAPFEQQEECERRPDQMLAAPGPSKQEPSSATQEIPESKPRDATSDTIRVGVKLLDKLMTLVGELVLARNQLLQLTTRLEDTRLLTVSQRMNLIAMELQEEVMKTRMQPIGNIWGQFLRTVRDVAHGCGKQVNIEMEGKETELDKTIIEAIKDPLTHLVRNSVDHGIELPADRVKAGKEPAGRLTLRAFHEGGQVNIEISDDGAGLNGKRILKKAVERGLITAAHAAQMPEREVFNLIFLPGFSTAEKVTNVSGRGVGMDVVKRNVERIGGVVDVESTPGQGTTVRVKIPLTLAIIPALIVTCGGDRYAIPQMSLLELVRLEADQARTSIEMVHGAPVYRLRGRLLPLVLLSRELQLGENTNSATPPSGLVNIVVLEADKRRFGLVVDQINDTEEIVVKPLRKQLKTVKTFAGSSIMGDGKVALILDVLGVAQRSGVVSAARNRALVEAAEESAEETEEKQTFLLFAGLGDSRMAIPLSTLARLEEFPISRVEVAGGQWVTQYRGQILPLIRLNVVLEERRHKLRALQAAPAADSGPLQVLVLNYEGRSFGLVVERILDIVEDRANVKSPAARPAVLCSVVIGERVTELLDIPAILWSQGVSSARPRGSAMKAAGGAN